MGDELVTITDAAKRLGVHPSRLREARDAGEIAVYRLGLRWERVRWSQIEAWLESHRASERNGAHQSA